MNEIFHEVKLFNYDRIAVLAILVHACHLYRKALVFTCHCVITSTQSLGYTATRSLYEEFPRKHKY